MSIIGCIPARFASTRLPGKPLINIANKPLILHVLERANRATLLDDIIVLTDDSRILKEVRDAGFRAEMTSIDCQNGTERIIDYLKTDTSADVFVNIQGDELLLNPHHVDSLIDKFLSDPNREMATLAHWVSDPAILQDPTTAKIVTDLNNNALYFSRQAIPVTQQGNLPTKALVQIGIYAYTRPTLKKLATTPASPLEKIEKLEQLRALENGIKIQIVKVETTQSLSIDTEDDLATARALITSY